MCIMNIYNRLKNKLKCIYYKLRYGKNLYYKYIVVNDIRVDDQGCNNIIEIGNHSEICNCEFKFYGSNNRIIIGSRTKLSGVTFWIGENENLISIGNDCWFFGGELAACEGTSIKIGNNNLFSHSLLMRTTDSHSIIDNKGKRINKAQNILIGNHVWIGVQVMVLKGSTILDNCVVGARSLVTSSTTLKSSSVILGSPAKVVKDNINWDIDRI